MEIKPILAIESSQSICSTCIYYNDEKYFQASMNLKNAHAEKVFDLVDSVIKNAGISFKSLGTIAISAGPGSFTGLRIGMSAAKGIAFGAGLPVVPVPTFDALALQISSYLPDNSEFAIANKVNMEEVYFAMFKVNGNSYIFTENLRIYKKEEVNFNIPGVSYFGNVIEKSGISAPYALYVAKWCRNSEIINNSSDFDNLEPIYLKDFIIKEKKK
jgi:tRNA threonylcarbamoyladenosine biosynthesis protein TsaB